MRVTKMRATSYGIYLWLFLSLVITSVATDTITLTKPIRDGESLLSRGGEFELGFFSPGSSGRRYVGIWFKNIPTQNVVWVANRENPLSDSYGVLKLTENSTLVLLNGTGSLIWSTNSSKSVENLIAQLLPSGNLVVRDRNDDRPDNFLWQSFDYPFDTLLPGMKLGRDLVTGFDRFLTSWKSSDDLSPGGYSYRMDVRGYPQPMLYKDSVVQFRDGPWNGVWFSGTPMLPTPMLPSDSFLEVQFVFNAKEIYYMYEIVNVSVMTKRILQPFGSISRLQWSNLTQGWATLYTKPNDNCDTYGICGVFSICNLADSPQCQCMKGFVPKHEKDWKAGEWSDGCVRSPPLNCSVHNGFIKYSNVKLPDTRSSWYSTILSLDKCKNKCLQNCSCIAYTNLDVTDGGSGCLLWFSDLIDVKILSVSGQDLYVRAVHSNSGEVRRIWIGIGSSLLAVLLIFGAILVLQKKRRLKREGRRDKATKGEWSLDENNGKEPEFTVFTFNDIANATNYFSQDNKLGKGGYGPVYKGVLNNGQHIAVKRLSNDSRQGLNEFKNEVMFIAKLQHRNLVKLIGCCVEEEEWMLIYEYMPNRSLDRLIFDQNNSPLLDWPKRLEIIKGITRGLLYLHQDSRLRIVHRDLKASNILLDSEMNPKISDFGLARTFEGADDEATTAMVIGTYGYMPPEYSIDGTFSTKSDVYSFGVLVLEIISGKRNRGFKHPDHHHNLLGHAWLLYKNGTLSDIVDPSIRNLDNVYQMQKSAHIGLLCVQQHPKDRPSMQLVTVMFSSDCELSVPREPGFYVGRNTQHESVSSNTCLSTIDETNITILSGR